MDEGHEIENRKNWSLLRFVSFSLHFVLFKILFWSSRSYKWGSRSITVKTLKTATTEESEEDCSYAEKFISFLGALPHLIYWLGMRSWKDSGATNYWEGCWCLFQTQQKLSNWVFSKKITWFFLPLLQRIGIVSIWTKWKPRLWFQLESGKASQTGSK